jgi:hypothetical protein
MTTPTAEGLTPDLYGYSRCARCGTWRPAHGLTEHRDPAGELVTRCADVAWCGRQVGFKGELTGAET